jgi:hypothetical protein
VAGGQFDSETVDKAVHADPVWSDVLETVSHNGVDYYSWGEDFQQDYQRSTDLRQLGVGYRLALYEDLLFWCAWTEGAEGMIDAAAGSVPSLADRADYGPIARAFDDANAHGAVLTNETLAADDSMVAMLAYFESFGVASVHEDGGPYMLIAIANTDEETAVENVERIQSRIRGARDFVGENPWAAGIESVEARAEGKLTIAELRGESLPWDFVIRQDDVLLHERAPE